MDNLLAWITSAVIPLVTAVVGWIIGRKKRLIKNKGFEIENLQSSMSVYNQMMADLKKHLEDLELRLSEMGKENKTLRDKLAEAKKTIRVMKRRIDSLEKKLGEYEKKYKK